MIWLRVAQGVLCAVEICGLYYLLQVFFDKRSNKAWSNILWFLSGVLLWGITVIQREGTSMYSRYYMKSTHNRRERPVYGHRGGSRGRFYYRITTFEERPWDARDPH